MINTIRKIIGLACVSAMFFAQCSGPTLTSDDWNPEFAAPLVNSSLSIQDLLGTLNANQIIDVDSSNFMTISYRNTVLSTDTITIIRVPNIVVPILDSVQSIPAPLPSDFEIDELQVKSGKLYFSFESNIPEDVVVTFTFVEVTENGNSFSHTINVNNPNGVTPLVVNDSVDLSGKVMNFSGGTFTTTYQARTASSNQGVLMDNFIIRFENLDYTYLKGYFGLRSFVIPSQELMIDIFNSVTDGRIQFEDPRVRLKFDNYYGFPIRIFFDTLTALTRGVGEIDLVVNGLDNGRLLDYPALNAVGQFKTTNITASKNNSNIIDVLAQTPFGFRYQFSGVANPDEDASIRGFITDNSRIEITVIGDLPLHGAVQNFTLGDTFNLDMSSLPSGTAEFKIISDNGFPLDADLQCYFLDANDNIVDSLFLDPFNGFMEAASIDGDGRVTASNLVTKFRTFSKEQVDNMIQRTAKMYLQVRLNSPSNGGDPVKIYTDYNVDVRIGVIAGGD